MGVRDKYGNLMWIFFPIAILHSTAMGFVFLESPTLPKFLFSAFDVSENWKYIFLPLEYFMIVSTWANAIFYIDVALLFCYPTIFWQKQIW